MNAFSGDAIHLQERRPAANLHTHSSLPNLSCNGRGAIHAGNKSIRPEAGLLPQAAIQQSACHLVYRRYAHKKTATQGPRFSFYAIGIKPWRAFSRC